MLMEDDLGNKPCMLHDSLALQATEKSLYDALTNNLDQNSDSEQGNYTHIDYLEMVSDGSPNSSGVKKNRSREDSDLTEYHRCNKQLANNVDESESLEMYDDVLIYSNSDALIQTCGEAARRKSQGGDKKKNVVVKEFADLKSLLMQCAQAMSNFDTKALNDLLLQIRQYSSPRGDGMERVAHYFANALEARLAGTGTALYAALNSKRISAAEILKAYKMFVIACPFRQMSNILANTTIGNQASSATTLHIIDFGILYGCQWPCLIHALSRRPGGPPKLRITGIDFPQPGFRPAERVEDTCRRLAKYGEMFGVPFEYNAIAQKWDAVRLEDLKIEKNELLVVNSMYRLHNVPDETETGNSPRDAVLNLIKRINPDMFIHGVANGNYNSPFFFTRFKEALFHFSTMFDMFEATIPQDDEDRLRFEQQFFGKEAMNIIACDGMERIERPETYKLWQVRTARAGFRQLSLDQEIIKRVIKVKTGYHKNFSVDEDGKWVLLGWKGRVIQGFSCWRPTHN
ncbi:scarecrow-like protein 14 [Phtheirospermum japonicum]|uniref:Scarecrow-like protein 14 n=1 Tax=Phtheirospermum japonicum TaxID=374723 RepID=A0A830D7A4_9LAMI|nr:scarecrow-like protein 14 [Phtheirospermum japonicum]